MSNDFFDQIQDTTEKKEVAKKQIKEVLREEFEDNKIAVLLKVCGWIIAIIGVIAGIVIAVDDEVNALVISMWAGSIITLISFLGFAEIIQLLQDIKTKMK